MYGLVWDQYTKSLQTILRGMGEYEEKSKSHNLLWFLEEMKKVVTGVDAKTNKRLGMYKTIITLFNLHQQGDESKDWYLNRL